MLKNQFCKSSDTTFERDCMDVGYVVRLSVADVLMSKDTNCTIPLARAAYPEKEVCSVMESSEYGI